MKDPLIGQQLANFRVERLLGRGGMATVYYGRDVKLDRAVAIKVIEKRFKGDPAIAQRFVNEARMMAKWRHENIVQIYYADDTQGYSYYVMEHVDGQDLATVMSIYAEEGKLMPIADVLRIGRAIAGALDYAHRQGVVHRDVKPSNVLIARDGRVLLSDFGMALEVRDGSMGNIFGTPHYISPEQARRSADAVPQSDLYSLGVILYEILTGSVPFNDQSPASIALQHIAAPPPPPRKINPDLSPAVEAILLKALEKDAQQRYQSGAKLMDALEAAFKGITTESKIPLPPLPVGAPTIQRSTTTISQIAKRDAPKKPAPPATALPATVRAGGRFQSKKSWLYLLPVMLLLGLGYYYLQSGSPLATLIATPTMLHPTETRAEESQPAATLPPPTFTPSAIPPTATSIPSATPTVIPPSATATVPAIATVKYPDGSMFILFWNETSFFLFNRSRAPRSLSGFAFQRLDLNGAPLGTFPGSLWNTEQFNYLPSKYCVGIKIFEDEDPPYLNPSECRPGVVSIIQPRRDPEDRHLLFWNERADSTLFRVLWLEEEVARCEINAGTCEFFVP